MINFFFALQAILVALMILVILSQQSSSGLGGLAGGNNQQQFFAGRPEASFMTRLTTILAGLFFLSSLTFAFFFGSFGEAEIVAAQPVIDATVGTLADEVAPTN